MTVEHVNITGANLHEPKGVASASLDQVYIADGASSGAWSFPEYVITAKITDISTAGQVYVTAPWAGTIEKVYSTINGAIGTADATLTPKIGGTAVTSGAITVAYSGSAAGDVDSSTPSAANAVTAGQAIEIETDGASSNAIEVEITLVVKRTA